MPQSGQSVSFPEDPLVFERRRKRNRFVNRGTRCQRCKRFLYDKETKTLCGRTSGGWFKVLCYYILFLIVAFALFIFMAWYVLNGIDETVVRKNKHQLYNGAFPGTSFVGSYINQARENLIWYTMTGADAPGNRRPGVYVEAMSDFIKIQEKTCKEIKGCPFKKESLGPCSIEDYGFDQQKPCIFLKLNTMHEWKPKPLDKSSDLPKKLKDIVNESRRCLWINCGGTQGYDDDNLGDIAYYPEQAFNEAYFPQTHEDFQPMVALHLENIKPGYIINLQCELYAGNINDNPNKLSSTIVYIKI